MLNRLLLIIFSVTIFWVTYFGDTVLSSGLLESRLNSLEYKFYSLESQLNRIESQLSKSGSQIPRTPNNSQLPSHRTRRLSRQERSKMFDRLATLVIELKEDIKDLQKRVNQLENK